MSNGRTQTWESRKLNVGCKSLKYSIVGGRGTYFIITLNKTIITMAHGRVSVRAGSS